MSEKLQTEGFGEGVWLDTGQHALTVKLPPHGMSAWRLDGEGVRLIGLRSGPNAEGSSALAAEVEILKTRDRTARLALIEIKNPSFESRTIEGDPEGWELTGVAMTTDTSPEAADGEQSLALVAEGKEATATSARFPLPTTGQFVLNFHALGEALSEDSSLRIEFLSEEIGYRVHTVVPAESLSSGEGDPAWRPVIFGVDDLPLGVDGDLQVRFVFRGSGRLWIDDLRADALMLPIEAYADSLSAQKLALVKIVHAAESALAEGRLADCQSVLDGYWPRFLKTYFPEVAPSVATDEEGEAGEDQDDEQQESMAERMRSYLPGFMR